MAPQFPVLNYLWQGPRCAAGHSALQDRTVLQGQIGRRTRSARPALPDPSPPPQGRRVPAHAACVSLEPISLDPGLVQQFSATPAQLERTGQDQVLPRREHAVAASLDPIRQDQGTLRAAGRPAPLDRPA